MRYYHDLRSLGKWVCQYEQKKSPPADRPEESVRHGVKEQIPDIIELDSGGYQERQGEEPGTKDLDEGDVYSEWIVWILTACQLYPAEKTTSLIPWIENPDKCFSVSHGRPGQNLYSIYDQVQGLESFIHEDQIHCQHFSLGLWYSYQMSWLEELEWLEILD